MKKIFAMFILVMSLFSTTAFAGDPLDLVGDRCAPGDVLFYGQSQDHKKEVLVCQLDRWIFYRFGKVGHKPELDMKVDVTKVDLVIDDNKFRTSEALLIKKGDIVYQVGHDGDLTINSGIDYLTVIDYGKGPVAEILLDSDTVVNGIRSNFTKR